MALKIAVMDGDRVIVVHTKRDVVQRMLEAVNPQTSGDAAAPRKTRRAAKARKPREVAAPTEDAAQAVA